MKQKIAIEICKITSKKLIRMMLIAGYVAAFNALGLYSQDLIVKVMATVTSYGLANGIVNGIQDWIEDENKQNLPRI